MPYIIQKSQFQFWALGPPGPPWVTPPENPNLGQKTPKLKKLGQELRLVKVSAKSVEKKVNLPTNDFTGHFV